MTSAELVFKTGFGPHLSVRNLEVLKAACDADDQRLTQGSTTTPPPLMCVQDWPVEAACALGFCGWQSDECINAETKSTTVGKVEEFFAMKCFNADMQLGEPAACRWFLNWFDETPRAEVLRTLAGWIGEMLAERAAAATGGEVIVFKSATDVFG